MVCTFLLKGSIANNGIIDSDACQFVVHTVLQIDERIGNVRNVESSVALSCEVNLPVLQAKCFSKLLVESGEFLP